MVDEERFDSLARTVATTTGRRHLLAGLAGVAGLLTGVGRVDAFTRCGKPGKKCKFKNGTKRHCCSGSRCKRRRCTCSEGRVRCGKRCCEVGQTCRAFEDWRRNPGFRAFECVTP
jgi:hypothetical protein